MVEGVLLRGRGLGGRTVGRLVTLVTLWIGGVFHGEFTRAPKAFDDSHVVDRHGREEQLGRVGVT